MAGVDIFLSKKNYDSQIDKHGSYMLWKSAQKCPCVDNVGNPNPACDLCYGRGTYYYDETEFEIYNENLTVVGNNCLEAKYGNIIEVVSLSGGLTVLDIAGKRIVTNETVDQYKTYTAGYKFDIKQKKNLTDGVYRGCGIIEFPTGLSVRTKFNRDVSGEIIGVSNLRNVTKAEDVTYIVDKFRQFVKIEDEVTYDVGDTFSATIEYVEPYLLLLVGISQKRAYEKPFILDGADATVTVKNHFMVNDGDVFIHSLGEQVSSSVLHTSGELVLPTYDVSGILRVQDSNGKVYQNGVDFMLIGRNKLKILTKIDTKRFVCKYKYHPAYTSFGLHKLPSLRYGENQEFPRLVNLQTFNKDGKKEIPNV